MTQKHSRAHIHEPTSRGEQIADGMAAAVGSWPFVIGQSCFILLWIVLNTVAFVGHWDPYPWILLNLCMSTQAMYTGPVILLSQNRQSAKDRVRDDTEASEVEQLFGINREQLEILQGLRDVRAILRDHTELLAQLLPERPTMLELPIVPSGDGRPARDPQTGRYAKATTVAQAKETDAS